MRWGRDNSLNGSIGGTGSDRQVEIYASTFPYTSSARLATAYTTYDGYFGFKFKPVRNTVYWAAYNGATSPRVATYVDLHYVVHVEDDPDPRWAYVLFGGPKGTKLGGRRVHWYLYRRPGIAYRMASGRLRVTKGPPSSTWAERKLRIHPPPGRRGDSFFVCLEEKSDDGFGKPDPSDAACGKKILR